MWSTGWRFTLRCSLTHARLCVSIPIPYRQGLATAPVLLAAEQQAGLDKLIKRKFKGPGKRKIIRGKFDDTFIRCVLSRDEFCTVCVCHSVLTEVQPRVRTHGYPCAASKAVLRARRTVATVVVRDPCSRFCFIHPFIPRRREKHAIPHTAIIIQQAH